MPFTWVFNGLNFVNKCQINFETVTGTVLTEAENHFNMSRMNYSSSVLKVCMCAIMECRHVKFCSKVFIYYRINLQYLMLWHIV